MLACDKREAWTQFLQYVKTKCSLTAFGNWLAPIRVLDSANEEITLEVPNIFVQDYLLSNYKKELCAFLPVNALGEPAISFVVVPPAKKPASSAVSSSAVEVAQAGQLYPEIKLNSNYRFENFIEGPMNQFVKSAAMGVAIRPGQSYNPLFIHGGVGLGKTHILHSMGHYMREHHKKLRIQCITTEAFINELVDSLKNKSVDRMKRLYRLETDVLFVDDIQFLEHRLNFEEEVDYTLEALKNKGAQIVITSDKPPSLLKLSERTIGKMEGGLVAHMGVPDLETRVAILQHKAEQKGFLIPNKVAFYIAERIHNNVRQLEGAVNILSAHCRLLNIGISEELVEKTLSTMLHQAPRGKISVDQILKCVALVFQVRLNELKSPDRRQEIVIPRQVAMYLAKEMIDESLETIGFSFGRKHSTILHAYQSIEKRIAIDETLRRRIEMVRQNIKNNR